MFWTQEYTLPGCGGIYICHVYICNPQLKMKKMLRLLPQTGTDQDFCCRRERVKCKEKSWEVSKFITALLLSILEWERWTSLYHFSFLAYLGRLKVQKIEEFLLWIFVIKLKDMGYNLIFIVYYDFLKLENFGYYELPSVIFQEKKYLSNLWVAYFIE